MTGTWFDGLAFSAAQRRRVVRDRKEVAAQHFAAVHGYIVTGRNGDKPHICRRVWSQKPYVTRPR
jgi:hypothetical protein